MRFDASFQLAFMAESSLRIGLESGFSFSLLREASSEGREQRTSDNCGRLSEEPVPHVDTTSTPKQGMFGEDG